METGLPQMGWGLHGCVQKNDTRPLAYITHKNKLKMG